MKPGDEVMAPDRFNGLAGAKERAAVVRITPGERLPTISVRPDGVTPAMATVRYEDGSTADYPVEALAPIVDSSPRS
jgi:hypothetical protein